MENGWDLNNSSERGGFAVFTEEMHFILLFHLTCLNPTLFSKFLLKSPQLFKRTSFELQRKLKEIDMLVEKVIIIDVWHKYLVQRNSGGEVEVGYVKYFQVLSPPIFVEGETFKIISYWQLKCNE